MKHWAFSEKAHTGKIRNFWNKITEKKSFFNLKSSVFSIFLKKYKPPSLHFILRIIRNSLLNLWSLFRFHYEMLKIPCHICIILMKRVRKIEHVIMKSFTHPYSTKERNETYLDFSRRFITYSTRIGNLDWCKCGHCKNEAREIDCLRCWEVDAMLICSVKSQSAREASLHPSFYGHLPNYWSQVLASSI